MIEFLVLKCIFQTESVGEIGVKMIFYSISNFVYILFQNQEKLFVNLV